MGKKEESSIIENTTSCSNVDNDEDGKLLLSWVSDEKINYESDEDDVYVDEEEDDDRGYLGPVRIAESKMGYGRGLFLTEPVDAGDVLCIIPNDKCISMEQAWEDDDLYTQLENTIIMLEEKNEGGTDRFALDDDSVALLTLATKVSKEYMLSSKGKKQESYWYPYLNELNWKVDPSQHVLWWTDDEMIQIQRDYGTEVYEMAMDWRKQINNICVIARVILLSMENNESQQYNQEDCEKVVRASLIHIYSRAFQDRDASDDNHQKLIPLLDMMQHSSDKTRVNIDHETDYDTGNVFVVALKDLEEGEELCFEYASSTKTGLKNSRGNNRQEDQIKNEVKNDNTLEDHLFFLIYGFLP